MKTLKRKYSLNILNIEYYLCILLCILSFGLNGQSIDLANFNSNCGIKNVTNALELSGITFNTNTQTFFAVSDNLSIYELDQNSTILRTISLNGYLDTEGIVWLGGNQYAITEERKREVVIINITSTTSSLTYPGVAGVIQVTDSGDGSNNGFEGLTYDSANDVLYIAKEGDEDNNNTGIEPRIYKITNPVSKVGTTISNPTQAFTNLPSCNNFDAAGLAFTPAGSLLLISEQCNILYELDANNGTVLSQKNIAGFTNPEGVTMINDNEIWVVGENNQISQYVIPGSVCDDGNVNTVNDVYNSACSCAGTIIGCATAGQSCNDGDPCTINDVYDNSAACNCTGTYSGDNDGDGVCAAQDPNDNDACNPNIIDSDNDNICDLIDSCPNFNNNLIGTACNDNNPNTINDVYTNNCICEGTSPAISGIDLANFNSSCGVQNVTNAVEISGITFNTNTQTFFAVSDNLSIYELDQNATILRTISLSGYQDTEGIVWLGGNQYGITEERKREVVIANITASTNSLSYPGASGVIQVTDSGDGSNNGFEGLAYDSTNDVLYIAKEGDQDNDNLGVEPRVYKITNPVSKVGTTISNPTQAFTNLPSCNNFDAAGLAFSPTGSLLLISEQCNILYELDANNGTVLSQKNIAGFTNPEGVTMINDNEIWLVGEDNQISQYVIPGSACDDGNANTINDIYDSSCACEGTNTSSCITQLPAQESFETNFGIWNQATNDDLDWIRNANGTPSNGTGPASASDGNYYAFIEASGVNHPNKTAILVSDCFDIPATGAAQISFDYHMLGNSVTMKLDFDVSTDNGTTWTNLWTVIGDQGNQWNTQIIDLLQYMNGPVLFRFMGTTGNSWKGDITIDAISIDLNNSDPCTEIDSEDFESGLGLWNDGGSDCYRGSFGNAGSGSYNVRLRDNSGTASSMFTGNINMSTYNEAQIDFYFHPNSMENNEDFFLEISTNGGASWSIYETWVRDIDFTNGTPSNESVSITNQNFTSTTRFRFRCDASGNGDQIYIDDVVIYGCNSGAALVANTNLETSEIEPATLIDNNEIKEVTTSENEQETRDKSIKNRDLENAYLPDFKIYPNPAVDKVFIDMGSQINSNAKIVIYNLDGKLIQKLNYNISDPQLFTLNISSLNNGMYLVAVLVDDVAISTKRLMISK